jgi:hypothetical protein
MPFPSVSHQRNKYSVFQKNGIKFIKQHFMGVQDFHQVNMLLLFLSQVAAGVIIWPVAAGPSVIGSSMIQIHPIRCPSIFRKGPFVGGKNEAQNRGADPLPCNHYYCKLNPCIDNKVHELHMQVLDGVQNAEHELNRYLLVCGMLEHCETYQKGASLSGAGRTAYIIWECDICHSGEHDVCMQKKTYVKQYRMWKPPNFCSSRSALRLPISECLVTPSEYTMHYDMLPDLGPFFRNMLQRFCYTESSRKLMLKSIRASVGNSNGWNCTASAQAPSYNFLNIWNTMMHSISVGLLLESIPCMKRSKRNRMFFSPGQEQDAAAASLTEVMACINVMHGTLLKLYPLGAKTPTFNTRWVHL